MKKPNDFLIGGSISRPQTEGTADKTNINIFDYWFDKEPDAFYNQIGSNITSNMYKTYKDDIELFEQVGIQILRTTIQWTRLIKNMDTWDIDPRAVLFYRDYFSTIKNKNIRLIINLFHFDIQMFWHKKGGWESLSFTDAFAKYAKICFELFGDIVDEWTTMNEPIVVSESFYAHDYWWPKLNNFSKSILVTYHQLLASAKAIKEFRQYFKNNVNKKIGIILNLSPAIPKNHNNPDDLKAANIKDLFANKLFLDTSIKGDIPELFLVKIKEIGIELDFN